MALSTDALASLTLAVRNKQQFILPHQPHTTSCCKAALSCSHSRRNKDQQGPSPVERVAMSRLLTQMSPLAVETVVREERKKFSRGRWAHALKLDLPSITHCFQVLYLRPGLDLDEALFIFLLSAALLISEKNNQPICSMLRNKKKIISTFQMKATNSSNQMGQENPFSKETLSL